MFGFVQIPLSSQVVINEYSVSNLSTITDNYSKYEDWIELYNAGASSANIGGYFLSDKIANPGKWQFPAGITIPAGGFIKIWASGRDEVSGGHYHTNFKLHQQKMSRNILYFQTLTLSFSTSLNSK
ncbi:MAG: lamin tail domain-containing protein [Bacteroidales bacterium]